MVVQISDEIRDTRYARRDRRRTPTSRSTSSSSRIDAGELKVLLVKVREGAAAGQWAFPGGLVGMDESLDDAARRELSARTGLGGIYLEQLQTFGDPGRDSQARVVSTAYFALVAGQGDARAQRQVRRRRVVPGPRACRRWPTITRRSARAALDRLRAKLAYTNLVYGLLPATFTLGELQEIYERILGRGLDRRNFRKRILASGLLRRLRQQRRGAHRPAALYRFAQRRPMVVEML